MAGIRLSDSDGSGLNSVFRFYIPAGTAIPGASDPTTQASYEYYPSNQIVLTGTGFTYDTGYHLVGGTITSINAQFQPKGSIPTSEVYTNISIPVSVAVAVGESGADARPAVYSGNDIIAVATGNASGFSGDDTFVILSAGRPHYFPSTSNTIDGGAGANTVVLPYALRSQAILSGGGGNETVVQSGITSTLTSIDKLQFLDGSVYEDNATLGGQAALVFEGIFGRLPDAINAGGYGQLAEQAGTPSAARAMLATSEAQANTANLDTTGFVARLYRNMLHRDPDTLGAAGWKTAIDSGTIDRGIAAGMFASSIEAQQANSAALASGLVFGADTNAVEVLRAFEVLLGRLPEAGSLGGNVNRLNSGVTDLAQVYRDIRSSTEFTGSTHANGLSAGSSFAAIRSVTLSDQTTALIMPLVTSQGVATHT